MTTTLHPTIVDIPLPTRMTDLPVNDAGYPVPWFVAWINNQPDFRIVGRDKLRAAIVEHRCWLCGHRIVGTTSTFTIGPMCTVNRVSSEPPSHSACATYAAQACPFLANPNKRRREHDLGNTHTAGVMIERNPGVTALWSTRKWSTFDDGNGETLFDIGNPTRVTWYREGRPATRQEVIDSIESGCPALEAVAAEDGPDAIAQLAALRHTALNYLPKAESL